MKTDNTKELVLVSWKQVNQTSSKGFFYTFYSLEVYIKIQLREVKVGLKMFELMKFKRKNCS